MSRSIAHHCSPRHKRGRGRVRALVALALALAWPLTASAQSYPDKPIKIIVPNAPGGLADICIRLLAAKLTEDMGQQVLVENRAGAGGTIGTAVAVKAPPDGHTLLGVFDSHATNPHLFKRLDYDTLADLAPVSLLVRGPMVLVVNPKLAVNTVEELVQLARAKPGALNFATVGPGSPARLMMELFKLAADIDVTMIAYKGAGTAMGELAGGQVDAMFATMPTAASYVRAGRLRTLAITTDQRSMIAPGIPTMSERYPGFRAETWVALLAPARTSNQLVTRLNAAVMRALAGADTKARFAEQGMEIVASTPGELEQWIRSEMERWGKVIRTQRIALE